MEAAKPVLFGFTAAELAIAAAPAALYGGFVVFRTLNPKATFVDFLQLVVAGVIIYNIYSIVVLKTRLF